MNPNKKMFKDLECPEYFVEYERNNDTEFRHIKRSCITDGWIPVDNGYDPDDLCLCWRSVTVNKERRKLQREHEIEAWYAKDTKDTKDATESKFNNKIFIVRGPTLKETREIKEKAKKIIYKKKEGCGAENKSKWFRKCCFKIGNIKEDFEYWQERSELELLDWLAGIRKKIEHLGVINASF